MTKRKPVQEPTIIRSKHDASNRWFLTLRSTAQDSRLSFEARGIFWYLLSKPDDWEVKIEDLQREGKIGRDKVKKALIELADANYLERPVRYKQGNRWAWTPYILHEAPVSKSELTENTSIETKSQSTEVQLTENQSVEVKAIEFKAIENQSILQSTENKEQKQSTEDKAQKQQKPEPKPLLPVIHPDFDRIKLAYEKNIGLIVPMAAQTIDELLAKYPAQWLEDAFDEAVVHNKRSLAYCKPILERWQREGRAKPVNGNGTTPAKPTEGKFGALINNDPTAPMFYEPGSELGDTA